MLSRLIRGTAPISRCVSGISFPLQSSALPFSTSRRHSDNVTSASPSSDAKTADTKDSGGSGSGDQKSGGSRWSKWTGKNAWKLGLIFLSSSGLISCGSVIYLWGPPPTDENGKPVADKYSNLPAVLAYTRRAFDECLSFNQSIRDPVSDSLLPDMLKPPYYQPPYTLVVEMNGILVHPDWTFKTGWRFKKRPGLDVFLQSVSPYFEVVCFTHEAALSAAPILQQIDPKGQFLHYRLFRESTRYRRGEHIKDLSCLNRPLNRVVIVDWNTGATQLQPRNAFHVDKWKGDDDDKELLDLAAFLRMLAMSGVDDIRSVLDYYREYDNPMDVFRDNQTKMMEDLARRREETEKKSSSTKLLTSWRFGGQSRR